jgi:hypothetical protein
MCSAFVSDMDSRRWSLRAILRRREIIESFYRHLTAEVETFVDANG